MANKAISTNKAPGAIGPYSQAVRAGNTVYVSGSIGLIPETGEFAGNDTESQTRQALQNIKNILAAEGYEMTDVVKATVLMKDIGDFNTMNNVYAEFFSEPYPARAAFQVAALPKNGLVEIEVIAVKD